MISRLSPSTNISYNQIANIKEDRFLFCITFPKLEDSCCCSKLNLKAGCILISLIFMICGGSSFLTVPHKSTFNFLSSTILLGLYSLNFLLIVTSSITNNYWIALSAYFIYVIVLVINIIEIIIVTIFIFFKIFTPIGTENAFVKGISFLLVSILVSTIYIYCLWIIWCYTIHLKYNRIDIVNGTFGMDYSSRESMNNGDNNSYKLL